MACNADLNRAGRNKKDEFYTQLSDIELELAYYPGKFRGKTVLCNCDDPFESNFSRYFMQHFNELGLSALITTSYAGSMVSGTDASVCAFLSSRGLDASPRPYMAVVRHVPEGAIRGGSIDYFRLFDDPENTFLVLSGNGDFGSPECLAALEASDIVVTNPPFSLFRRYIGTLVDSRKDFLIIGNVNAVTFKEVFPLISSNRMWLGASIHSGDRKFYVPDDYPLEAVGCGTDESGRRYIRVKGVRWFTNMDMSVRHEELSLRARYDKGAYPSYENYRAINVGRTSNIPCNYAGLMGVPVTYLDKYCPDQFEVVMLANGNARTCTDAKTLERVGYQRHPNDAGGVGILNGRRTYARIIVRNLHPEAA